jgi:hypothetical protein
MSRTNERRQLRDFGLIVGGIFGAIGLWPLVWRQEDLRVWALVLAGVLVVPALLAPRILAPAHRFWMALGAILAWVNTRILLGVVFYGLVTPMGLAMRLMGRDPMHRKLDQATESYRVRCQPRPAAHMTRQF